MSGRMPVEPEVAASVGGTALLAVEVDLGELGPVVVSSAG